REAREVHDRNEDVAAYRRRRPAQRSPRGGRGLRAAHGAPGLPAGRRRRDGGARRARGAVSMSVSAAILAGGKSRRMGRDKAWLDLGDGVPLVRRVASALALV